MALNFTIQYQQAKKANPNLTYAEFEKQFKQQEGGAEYLQQKRTDLVKTAESNYQRQEDSTRTQYGDAAADKIAQENDAKRQTLQGNAQNWGIQYPTSTKASTASTSKLPVAGVSQTADTAPKKDEPSIYQRLRDQRDEFQSQYLSTKGELEGAQKDLSNVSMQVQDFGSQMSKYATQVDDLIKNLNSKNNGLGDQVKNALDELAQSGFQGELTEDSLKQIEQIALESSPQQLEQNIKGLTSGQQLTQESQMQAQQVQQAQLPMPEIAVPNKQQYKSLQQSGMTAQQIVTQQPELSGQVIPDGTIINPSTGVGLIQTPMGEAYQLPSGLVVPRDPSSGFYDVSALSPEDQKKLTYSDVLALDLSTKKTASDLKAFYNATTFQQMAQSNEREYKIAELQLDAFFNKESNRINEDKVQNMQKLELERMRQDLSKETTIKQLNEAKAKTANIMKAQMDAYGLEGSSAMLSAMSAHNLKFEQEASLITKTYDINIKELALASSNAEMAFTNRVTELNQSMQVQKLDLRSEYLNKKDEIDRSALASNIEKMTEQQNMYSDYAAKIYDAEQQAQAAAAEAQKEAQAEMWEKQKYYAEQLGMLVSVGEDGSITPMLDEEGNPVQTLSGIKTTMEGEKFMWEQEKYATDYDLRLQQFQQDQFEFGIDAEFRQQQFEENVRQFGMDFALKQDEQYFNQSLQSGKFGLEQEKYYNSLSQFDEIEWSDDLGTYIGKGPGGITDLGADFGKAGVAVPTNGKYDYTVSGPGEVRFNVQEGSVVGDRWQCGEFVNDALFGAGGHFKNSFSEKMEMVNSQVPVAGGAFVENINGMWTGHVGLVEKVNPDGSFEIVESNYKKNSNGVGVVSRTTVYPGDSRWQTIVEGGGFYDPLKGGSSKRLGPAPEEGVGIDADFKTEGAGQAFAAVLQANAENANYQKLTQGKDSVKFADQINIISRKLSDSDAPLSQEVINKYVDDPDVRGAILAESRWIAAVLRKESGAAISQGEYLSMGTQFFPRAGDDEATLKMKEEARARKEAGLLEQSGSVGKAKFESIKDKFSPSLSSGSFPSLNTMSTKSGSSSGSSILSGVLSRVRESVASGGARIAGGYSLPPSLGGQSYDLPDY